ncbi:MAG: hypothetical protein ACQKBW_00935, partial [Puniceicoccales bacterium]
GKAVFADMADAVSKFRKIGIKEIVKFDPKTIRFTQDSISNAVSDKRSDRGLIDDLKAGNVTSDDIPVIRVFEKKGKFVLWIIDGLKPFKNLACQSGYGKPPRKRSQTNCQVSFKLLQMG